MRPLLHIFALVDAAYCAQFPLLLLRFAQMNDNDPRGRRCDLADRVAVITGPRSGFGVARSVELHSKG